MKEAESTKRVRTARVKGAQKGRRGRTATRGAYPVRKKWSRGKGIMLTASFRRSELSCPGNRRVVVIPAMTRATEDKREKGDGISSVRASKFGRDERKRTGLTDGVEVLVGGRRGLESPDTDVVPEGGGGRGEVS